MGDNRDDSLDSRYWGFLPERLVVGEGLILYWSWDSDVPMYRLASKVRWSRLLRLIR
jgi:signal peptidase I